MKSGYYHFAAIPHVPPNPAIWKAVWSQKSIPKVDMFYWTVVHRGALSGENLK
jgi:hypothetical protein